MYSIYIARNALTLLSKRVKFIDGGHFMTTFPVELHTGKQATKQRRCTMCPVKLAGGHKSRQKDACGVNG